MKAADKKAVLLIAGIDPQGCAGLTVDQLTVQSHGLHPLPLISCLTQQTAAGLQSLGAVPAEQFMQQYQCCVADFDIAAIKIGLIPDLDIARCIRKIIRRHGVPVVMDPVLAASSGGIEAGAALIRYIRQVLLPDITLLTPNLPELKRWLPQYQDPCVAAAALLDKGLNACLVKGGHGEGHWVSDYFVDHVRSFFCWHSRTAVSVRGTGCALASSLACYLAQGMDIRDAVVLSSSYVARGIRQSQALGPYHVLHHDRALPEYDDLPQLCYQAAQVGEHFEFPRCPDKLGIYPVVDSVEWLNKVLREGVKTVQLRIKEVDPAALRHAVRQAVKISQLYENVALFINDHWQLAVESGAYGVHLGQEDLQSADLAAIEKAGLRLGVSTHSYWELAAALAVNPSYIALGPIFETTSKTMPFAPQGVEKLRQWVRLLAGRYPLVAIGGITLERAAVLKQTGVGSIAMISAVTQAEDYRAALRHLQAVWQTAASG